jgi:TP901 family phage tail tape measure protein
MAINLGTAFGTVKIDASGVADGMKTAKDSFDSGLGSIGPGIQKVGQNISGLGTSITALGAPVVAAFAVGVKSALGFDKAVTNVGAVMGLTRDEIDLLKKKLLAIGGDTIFGPQEVADAYYDIAGGVADASTHMAILEAAVATATAGNADLGSTTNALIAVMNSYKLGADDAGYASDVLTQTVGKGVGTMDEFAAALPSVTGLANSLGISFSDLGGMTAYLTTQGNSASEATTQLSAMMTALLNPNETMKKALGELGFETGQAAIDSLGLVGAYDALSKTQTISNDGMAKATGSVEALRGVTALAGPDVGKFMTTFTDGVKGATDAAAKIQMESPAQQFAKMTSEMSAMQIQIGDAVIPALVKLWDEIQPVIESIKDWITKNPELTAQIAKIALGAVIVGGGLAILGTIISGVGVVIGVVTGLGGLLTTGFGFLAGITGLTSVSFSAAAVSAWAMLAPMLALATPILAVTTAALAAILAVKQLIDTVNQVNAAGADANVAVTGAVNRGQATNDDIYKNSFNAVSSQFGGGIFGDVAARLFYTNVAKTAGAKADGGAVSAGQQYLVGERGPEMFRPGQDGMITPNDAMGGVTINGVTIHANSAAEGRAAAEGFEGRLRELLAARGGM